MLNKIKYRWTHAPLWVKVVDMSCWVTLFVFISLDLLQ